MQMHKAGATIGDIRIHPLLWVLLFIVTGASMWILESPWALATLFIAPIAVMGAIHYRSIYFLALIFMPLSTELYISSSLMVELPTEFFMILLTGIFVILVLYEPQTKPISQFLHPIVIVLLAHIGWMSFSTVINGIDIKSIKFLLAKAWFVGAFLFMSLHILKLDHVQRFFNCIFWPLIVTVVIVLFRHAWLDFSFADVNKVLSPFYRNHVNYAAMITLFFPFVFYLAPWRRSLWVAVILLMFVAIYFTYTRAAYIALIAGMGYYFILKYKLTRLVIAVSIIAAIIGLAAVIRDNQYLQMAPNYENTISHQEFDDLIAATYHFEDVSTMERLHRWVAGFRMIADRPWAGFGPNQFYDNYWRYTVTSFKTYISDNPERSGIHSYYFMTAVEQGLVGLFLYLIFCFYTLIIAERAYHSLERKQDRALLLASISCIVMVHLFQLINDLLEADKIGPMFFISVAWVVLLDLRSRSDRLKELEDQNPNI